jgi:hypothetical protein
MVTAMYFDNIVLLSSHEHACDMRLCVLHLCGHAYAHVSVQNVDFLDLGHIAILFETLVSCLHSPTCKCLPVAFSKHILWRFS